MSFSEIIFIIVAALQALLGTQHGVQAPAQDELEHYAQVVHVSDGDTIVVRLEDGSEERVRYIGIDTPEIGKEGDASECYGQEATDRNTQLVSGVKVRLVADAENRDRFDRLLRYVYVDDVLVQEVLLKEGYATTLSIRPNTAKRYEFAQLQDQAKEADIGLWSQCQ